MPKIEIYVAYTVTEDRSINKEFDIPEDVDIDDVDAVHDYLNNHPELWDLTDESDVNSCDIVLDEIEICE